MLPGDVLEILSAYGDSTIADQINLLGPRSPAAAAAYFGPRLMKGLDDEEGPEVLPRPGGLFLWATTPDADLFCLRNHGGVRWTVSFYDGQNLYWTHTEDEFSDWLLGGLVGKPRYGVLPPWPARRPHRIVPFGPDPFGIEERKRRAQTESGENRTFVCPECRAVGDMPSIMSHWCAECENEVNFVPETA